jgi:putative tricarboxylic transport membrane protein
MRLIKGRRDKRLELQAFAAIVLIALATSGSCQSNWIPQKAVEIIAPSAPGGSTDATARTIQKLLQNGNCVAVPLSVVNKPGGNQALAIAYLNQHAGDAHYLVIANPTLNSNYITGISGLRYVDVTPIALLSSEYTVFTVKTDSPIRNVADLAQHLKKGPESIAIGITTRGGTNHIVLCLIAKALGVDIRQLKVVAFRSNAESMIALLGGHLQLVSSTVAAAVEPVRMGNARFLAIASPQRMTGVLANTPTFRENGIPVAKTNWRAIAGAGMLTAAQAAYWEDTLAKLVKTDDWRKTLETEFWENTFISGPELLKFLEREYTEDRLVLAGLGLAK